MAFVDGQQGEQGVYVVLSGGMSKMLSLHMSSLDVPAPLSWTMGGKELRLDVEVPGTPPSLTVAKFPLSCLCVGNHGMGCRKESPSGSTVRFPEKAVPGVCRALYDLRYYVKASILVTPLQVHFSGVDPHNVVEGGVILDLDGDVVSVIEDPVDRAIEAFEPSLWS